MKLNNELAICKLYSESLKRRIMYIRQNPQSDKPLQLLDFVLLKKKNPDKSIISHHSKITFHTSQQPVSIPMILAIYQFTSGSPINQEVFTGFNLNLFPKQYQTYAHQKTLKAFLKIIVSNADSQNTLVSLVNQFPIIGFVLEAYCRAVCMNYMKTKKEMVLYGNEQEVLEDFGFQVRGQLLNVMADALGMHVTFIIGEIVQNYGSESNRKKVRIKFSENEVEAELMNGRRRQNETNNTRRNESSGVKNLKQMQSMQTETSESHQVSSIQGNSIMKEGVTQSGKCEKCKMMVNKCFCSKKVMSTYTTPKSTVSNSSGRSPVPGVNSNIFAMLNHSKCTCHKLICICRK